VVRAGRGIAHDAVNCPARGAQTARGTRCNCAVPRTRRRDETAAADSALAGAFGEYYYVVRVREGLRLHQVAATYLRSAVVLDSMPIWMRHAYDKCNGQ
jgi:hypothetical protein